MRQPAKPPPVDYPHDEETPTVDIRMAATVNAGLNSIAAITDNDPDAV